MAQDGWSCLMMAARGGDYGTTKALLDTGADLYLGADMVGYTAFDISSAQASGKMGVRMSQGDTMEEVKEKHRRVTALLAEYAARRNRN